MKVLLLGSGGREHALAWKISESPLVTGLSVLPGSDAIGELPKVVCVEGDASDRDTVIDAARAMGADLVVIGPEKPLAAGVSDALRTAGFAVMGPSRAAAQLETSKIFAKEFMRDHGVPTAPFQVAEDADAALKAVSAWDVAGRGVVLKADGLAAGKGVVVTHDRAEAERTVRDFMLNPDCAVKTARLLIEEKIVGREVSAFALCDGNGFVVLGYACDYKRVGDGDRGPNTGGMGGYAPQGWPSDQARRFVEEHIFRKVVDGMRAAGTPFQGILFAGLMIDGDDVQVIEFKARLGDPETQILMPLIDGDVVPLFDAAARGNLRGTPAPLFYPGTAVHVVMASEGYPETFRGALRLGQDIAMPAALPGGARLFVSGAKKVGTVWVNTGGRVLGVTALGADKAEARARAYDAIGRIRFSGAHWRKDIAAGS